MRLRELVHAPAITCSPTTTLSDAAHLMHLHDIGALIVVDDAGKVAGIVSDRDLALKGFGRSLPAAAAIADVMTTTVTTIGIDDDTDAALSRMIAHAVRRLPVVDADGALCGIIALDDLTVFIEGEADLLRRAVSTQLAPKPGWAGGWDQG